MASNGVRNLTKDFGEVRALDSVSLDILPGEIHALLGANGAGKSTLMRCLLGYLRPTGGEVFALGGSSENPGIRARIGYLPGELRLPRRATVGEMLSFRSRLLAHAGRRPRAQEELLHYLGVPLERQTGTLSKGNRQKVGLALALVGDPELLILDEPTSGLDPLKQGEVLEVLRERRAAGAAILLSTHILAEAEVVADRVAVLSKGCLVTDQPIDAMLQQARQKVDLTLELPAPADLLADVAGVLEAQVIDRDVRLIIEGSLAAAMQALAPYGVRRIETHGHDLDDLFWDSVGEER